MYRAEDVISIYSRLLTNGIPMWLVGGWGIDALLGEQTRPHKDLDIIILLDDVAQMRELLSRDGYGLKELWSENRWVIQANGARTATAFVLRDLDGRDLDVHAMRLDDCGNGIPMWGAPEGLIFKQQELAGQGVIARVAVQCITAETQMRAHVGYELPGYQLRDLELLHDKFGVTCPDSPRLSSA